MAAAIRPTTRSIDPRLVLQVYEHECTTSGAWGAYKRTGDKYGKSDQWAINKVKQAKEQQQQPKDDLAYEPPDKERHQQYLEARERVEWTAFEAALFATAPPTVEELPTITNTAVESENWQLLAYSSIANCQPRELQFVHCGGTLNRQQWFPLTASAYGRDFSLAVTPGLLQAIALSGSAWVMWTATHHLLFVTTLAVPILAWDLAILRLLVVWLDSRYDWRLWAGLLVFFGLIWLLLRWFFAQRVG